MKTEIQTIHFNADQKLLDHVNKKITKVERFLDEATEVHVYLKLDALNGGVHHKVAEIKVPIRGRILFAKEQSMSFEESVDKALDNILNQVKKHKEKTRE